MEKSLNCVIIQCPHCFMNIEVLEYNCRIFRCGVLKETFIQIDPHLSKEKCEELFLQEKIYGCGKPFLITKEGIVEKCDYI